jgi:membrane fusion protein (multidrug efflux system)
MRLTIHRPGRLAALALVLGTACGEDAPPPPPPVDVVVATAAQKDVPITLELIGTTEGSVDAEIRAQVSGYLVSLDYAEGTFVEQGAPLFHIDPRTYRATLEQARGDLARARAALTKAQQDVARYTPLAEVGAVSQKELDDAVQAQRAGEAAVQTARAGVEKAELDLSFTSIQAPIAGIAGVAQAQLGDLVGPGDPEPLTTLSQLDPIYVAIPLSERDYLRFSQNVRAVTRGGAPREERLELVLANGEVWPHRGRAVPAAAEVDPATGTILIRGEFANPDLILRKGQYARVRAVTDVIEGAVLVPQRAVAELQGVSQVAVVNAENKVALRVVVPGVRHGTDQVISEGLQAGERVVVEGLQKVREGTLVNPKPVAEPAATATRPGVQPSAATPGDGEASAEASGEASAEAPAAHEE